MAVCPCGIRVKEWEAVCKDCWRALGRYDKKFGSRFQKMVVRRLKEDRRRDVVNTEMLKVIKERVRSRRSRRIERIREKMKRHCLKCEVENGRRDIDQCFNCAFHIMFNQIFKEILNGH